MFDSSQCSSGSGVYIVITWNMSDRVIQTKRSSISSWIKHRTPFAHDISKNAILIVSAVVDARYLPIEN
jgi:hypothetical protein